MTWGLRGQPWLISLAGYGSLALVLTWPLAIHLATVVPHDLGDPLLCTWILWWNAYTMPLTSAWWNAPMFWPMSGALALSEHLLGVSLVASPLQWLGADPVTAYNIVFLLSFPLCAVAAHALAFTLTARHDAAAVAGLAFAFNPYRTSHLPHLQMLWTFWMPLALLALHRYARDARLRWLVVFATMWVGQALSSGYFLLFFPVLTALWLAWFLACRRDLPQLIRVAAAWAIGSVLLLPIVVPYQRVHQRLALQRSLYEIRSFSADVSAFAAASPLAPASRLLRAGAAEQELFPGIMVVGLIVVAVTASLWQTRREPASYRRLQTILGAAACGLVVLALLAPSVMPWQLHVAGITIVSVTTTIKPLTAAIWCLVLALAVDGRLARAWRARSALAFYVCAAAVMYVLSFGPEPSFLGEPFWYKPPYAWLMELPGLSSVRAPARFAMLAELCLAVAAALAFASIRVLLPRRFAAVAAVIALCGIAADGWIQALPLVAVPPRFASLESTQEGAVVELPLGDTTGDLAALYRSIYHHRPLVNGYSGFEPVHYTILRLAVERDTAALDALTSDGPLTVLEVSSGRVTTIEAAAHAEPAPTGHSLSILAATADGTVVGQRPLVDGDPMSRWISGAPQHGTETLTIDLGSSRHVDGVTLSIGPYLGDFPRVLTIETSEDLRTWKLQWSGRGATKAVAGALRDPRTVPLTFGFASAAARWVRLRQLGTDPKFPWSIADLTVSGR